MTEQRMVYVVTRGQHSGYEIIGVYESQAQAERIAELMTGVRYGYEASVEEWPLNDPPATAYPPASLRWYVTVDDDGRTSARRLAADVYDLDGVPERYGNSWDVIIWAPDEESARRAGQDRIAEYRAAQAGLS